MEERGERRCQRPHADAATSELQAQPSETERTHECTNVCIHKNNYFIATMQQTLFKMSKKQTNK